jgi:hypothetical protein
MYQQQDAIITSGKLVEDVNSFVYLESKIIESGGKKKNHKLINIKLAENQFCSNEIDLAEHINHLQKDPNLHQPTVSVKS